MKILKFIGAGYSNNYQVKIKIYEKNKLILKCTTYNGEIKVPLEENKIYKIKTQFQNQIKNITLYVSKQCKYVFILPTAIINRRTITFTLVDEYYNLPIERGEIILWQNQ